MPELLRVALVTEHAGYLPFIIGLGELLAGTGEVAPSVLLCRDDIPEPSLPWPLHRLSERAPDLPRGDYDWDDLTGFERRSLAGMENYFAGRYGDAARALAAETERCLAAHLVDCVVVWSGTRLNSRTVAAAARAMGVAVVTLETPFFPRLPGMPAESPGLTLPDGYTLRVMVWDRVCGPQTGPSQITEEWAAAQVAPDLHVFLRELQESRQSKFNAADISRITTGQQGGGQAETGSLVRPEGHRVLLACGQLDWDSSLYYGEAVVNGWEMMVNEAAARLPRGWVLWFKAHPLDMSYRMKGEEFAADLARRHPGCRCLPPTMNIHAAIQAADAVLCINSTVGLEATTYGKPVVNLGTGFYVRAGFTRRVERLEDLGEIIRALPARLVKEDEERRDRFLSYLLYHYLIPVGRPDLALARIREAIARKPAARTPQGEEPPEQRAARLAGQVQAWADYVRRSEADPGERLVSQLTTRVRYLEGLLAQVTSRRLYRWCDRLARGIRRLLPGGSRR